MQLFAKPNLILPPAPGRNGLLSGAKRNPYGFLCLALTFLGALGQTSLAQSTNEAPRLEQIVLVKSVFVDNPTVGKDPFFPTRRGAPAVTETNRVVASPLMEVSLNGLSGTKAKRLAIINNRTFEVGEEAEVKTATGLARVRCLAIRESSAMIHLNGQPQEIHLAQTHQKSAPVSARP